MEEEEYLPTFMEDGTMKVSKKQRIQKGEEEEEPMEEEPAKHLTKQERRELKKKERKQKKNQEDDGITDASNELYDERE